MGIQHPGTREWTEVLRDAYTGPLTPGTPISLGGEIHDSLIPATIRPGTRSYYTAMLELKEGAPPEPEDQHVYEPGIYEPGIYE
jgi:hypothetical protein